MVWFQSRSVDHSSPHKWHTSLQMTALPKEEIQTLTSLMAFIRSRTGHLLTFLSLITPIKHLTFHKGEYIGHLEPAVPDSTDQWDIHNANSVTLKKMMSETITPDTFNPPQHELSATIQDNLQLLLQEHEAQFAKDETTIGTTPLTSMTIDTGTTNQVSQKPYPIAMKHYNGLKEEIEKLLAATVILHQPLQLVSTHYSCTKR